MQLKIKLFFFKEFSVNFYIFDYLLINCSIKLNFTNILSEKYYELSPLIKKRIEDFSYISQNDWFYEIIFCLCTPQSKAANALIVQNKLYSLKFYDNPFNPASILANKANYIRFHNQKGKNIIEAQKQFPNIRDMLESGNDSISKRYWLSKNIRGIGLKESSHFLRNIGYRNLAILDRHILKHLNSCGVIEKTIKISNEKQYFEIEKKFRLFSELINIPMDELDLLFWSMETGEILK